MLELSGVVRMQLLAIERNGVLISRRLLMIDSSFSFYRTNIRASSFSHMNTHRLYRLAKTSHLPADLSVDEDNVVQSQDQFADVGCSLVLPVNTSLFLLQVTCSYFLWCRVRLHLIQQRNAPIRAQTKTRRTNVDIVSTPREQTKEQNVIRGSESERSEKAVKKFSSAFHLYLHILLGMFVFLRVLSVVLTCFVFLTNRIFSSSYTYK